MVKISPILLDFLPQERNKTVRKAMILLRSGQTIAETLKLGFRRRIWPGLGLFIFGYFKHIFVGF
jgi:hypothetical protein